MTVTTRVVHPVELVFSTVLGDDPPFRVTGYDGTDFGPSTASVRLHVARPEGLRYLLTAPGELGLGRAYVTGALELRGVHPGNPYPAFAALHSVRLRRPTARQTARLTARLGPRAFRRPPLPSREAPARWKRALLTRLPAGARARVARSIRFHYDVGNDFFSLVLGPSMAYSCAVFAPDDGDLASAQQRKYALIADKLDLQPGQRMLDIGCGWGGLVCHVARERGVRALGVTVSHEQARWARRTVAMQGLAHLVEIRLVDYRDIAETGFDAISSVGMAEHVGARRLGRYFEFIGDRLRVGGRVVNHCITRAGPGDDGAAEPFTDRYVFPNGELVSAGRIINDIDAAGLEVHHMENLRLHYARTLQCWSENLERNWDQAVAEVGEETAKVWGMYLAGARFSFESNWLHLSQVMASKPAADGHTAVPLASRW